MSWCIHSPNQEDQVFGLDSQGSSPTAGSQMALLSVVLPSSFYFVVSRDLRFLTMSQYSCNSSHGTLSRPGLKVGLHLLLSGIQGTTNPGSI